MSIWRDGGKGKPGGLAAIQLSQLFRVTLGHHACDCHPSGPQLAHQQHSQAGPLLDKPLGPLPHAYDNPEQISGGGLTL